jgi:metal-dependent amidase/aminoacylase/carboxypeptidase family protein
MVHPSAEDRVHSTSLACSGLEVTFVGKAAHAVAHPEKGINALQPLIQLFVEVESAKGSWGPEVKAPGAILEGGVRANIVPERTVGQFTVRAPSIERVRQVRGEIEEMVRRIAGAADTEFHIRSTDEPYFEMVTNPPLAEAYRANLAALGRTAVDGPRVNQGSLDMGNVSYVCPSIHPFVSICPAELASHTREFGQASVSPRGESALLDSVKAMAMTAVDLLVSPELVREARQAFDAFQATLPDSKEREPEIVP